MKIREWLHKKQVEQEKKRADKEKFYKDLDEKVQRDFEKLPPRQQLIVTAVSTVATYTAYFVYVSIVVLIVATIFGVAFGFKYFDTAFTAGMFYYIAKSIINHVSGKSPFAS